MSRIGWSPEEIKHRNEQYRRFAVSRNPSEICRADYEKLDSLVEQVQTGYKTKSEKSALLKEIRKLSATLGVSVGNYNSSDFGRK